MSPPSSTGNSLLASGERFLIEPTAETVARIEKTLTDVQHTLAVQFQRIADMKAELDRLSTTVRDLAQTPGSRR